MVRLTVICPCYNQERFIGQTLEGFVRQKTDFEFIVLVGDDASTDGTAAIVRQYGTKYPNIIRPVPRNINLGASGNALDLFQRISSDYAAICEGDDYWTDERKLQKQVDFLEANPGCALCFHPVAIHNELDEGQDEIFPKAEIRFNKLSLSLGDLLRHNFIQTNSVVYRWRFREKDPELAFFINSDMQPADYVLHFLHAETGSIECLDEIMAVYRRHAGGMWAGASPDAAWFLKYGLPFLNFQVFKARRFNFPQPKIARNTAQGIIAAALAARDFALLGRRAADHSTIYAQAAADLKNYVALTEKSGVWREGLTWARWRCRQMTAITYGRRRERYLRKIDELETLLGVSSPEA